MNPHLAPVFADILNRYSARAYDPHACAWCGNPTCNDSSLCTGCEAEAEEEENASHADP